MVVSIMLVTKGIHFLTIMLSPRCYDRCNIQIIKSKQNVGSVPSCGFHNRSFTRFFFRIWHSEDLCFPVTYLLVTKTKKKLASRLAPSAPVGRSGARRLQKTGTMPLYPVTSNHKILDWSFSSNFNIYIFIQVVHIMASHCPLPITIPIHPLSSLSPMSTP